jgi:hypothetical protein
MKTFAFGEIEAFGKKKPNSAGWIWFFSQRKKTLIPVIY